MATQALILILDTKHNLSDQFLCEAIKQIVAYYNVAVLISQKIDK